MRAFLLAQMRQACATDAVNAEEIDLELSNRLFRRGVFDRARDAEAGVADRGVEGPFPRYDLLKFSTTPYQAATSIRTSSKAP